MQSQNLINKSGAQKKSDAWQRKSAQQNSHDMPSHPYDALENANWLAGDLASAAECATVIQRQGLLHRRNDSRRVQTFLRLQQLYGNQFVQRVIAQHAVQAKLEIGQPGDIYEQEADRIAEQVMKMTEPPVQRQPQEEEERKEEEEPLYTKPVADQITPLVQKQPEEEEEKEEEELQMKASPGQTPEVAPDLESRINAMKGGGQPLSESERTFYEPRFGCDFSQVRIHSEPEADTLNREVGARSFTSGQEIFFRRGEYDPGSSTGRQLLAHELTHVVQQSSISESTVQQIVRGDITGMSITQEWAHDLTYEELDEQIRIVHDQLDTLSPDSSEYEVARSNLDILQREVVTRSIQQIVHGNITWMSITQEWARDLTDEELEAQINVVRSEVLALDPTTPEHGVARQNLQILEAEAFLRQATLVIDQPKANSRFNIDATPTMPMIACRSRIDGNVTPDPTPHTNFNWQITITEIVAPDTCASSRIGNCTLNVHRNNVAGGSWTPAFPRVQGGDAVITASANVRGRLLRSLVNVSIRGTNPGAANITAQCGGAGTDADRVACHESGRRQFNAGGNPLLGPGGDVGVMQLCNPAASCLQRWNWRENINAGVTLLGGKQNAATRYLNTHMIGGNYPNSLGLNNAAVLQRETLQRYNGGRYWAWVAVRNQWEPNPPNNYVANLLAHC